MLPFSRQLVSPEDLIELSKPRSIKNFKGDTRQEDLEEHLKVKALQDNCKVVHAPDTLKIMSFREGYASVFKYKREQIEKAVESGSISGWKGEVYSDWVYLDIDMGTAKESLLNAKDLIKYMMDNGIKHKIFASGRKGIHIYIPMQYISVPEELKTQANRVCKAFSKQLEKQFPGLVLDTGSIYSNNTVFRMPFSLHPGANEIKTPIIIEDGKVSYMPFVEGVMDAIRAEMFTPDHSDIQPHWELDMSFFQEQKKPEGHKEKYEFPSPYGQKACMYRLMQTPLKKGDNRNNYAMRIMSWLKNDIGLPNEWVWEAIVKWNDNVLEDKLEVRELEASFRGINRYRYNQCDDALMQEYCVNSNVCQFYQAKDVTAPRKAGMLAMLDKYQEDIVNRGESFNLNKVFEGMDVDIYPNTGFILEILADKKVGKTMLAILIALEAKQPTIVFSAEVNAAMLC